ncbi:MAG: hypothetical protein HY535_07470 [Chloroflexi bacterium]|nr:hypothetical protein [Chloroflexota bacterium]
MLLGLLILAILFLALLIIGVLALSEDFPKETIINKTQYPIIVDINGFGGPLLKAGETQSSSGPRAPAERWVIKAHEFVPGKGKFFGWYEQGKFVPGGEGQLLFCMIYSLEELELMNRVITITQNVVAGKRLDDPSSPCP